LARILMVKFQKPEKLQLDEYLNIGQIQFLVNPDIRQMQQLDEVGYC
jgi:hypothetical protein